mgnify:CR=1 FL=1
MARKARAANGRASTLYKANNQFEKNKIRKLKRRFKATGELFICSLIAKYQKDGIKYSRKPSKTRHSVKPKTVAAYDSTYGEAMQKVRDVFWNGFEASNRTAEEQLCELLGRNPRISRKRTRKIKVQ